MRRLARSMLVLALGASCACDFGGPPWAAAHHVGAYAARDNDISANFKQMKFAIQARKLDVALRLFEGGALRKEMQARATRLPPGLEQETRAAFQRGDGRAAELDLAIFVAALARDLAEDADRTLAQTAEEARAVAGARFLEAIWRYYNLVDFAISARDIRTAVAVRLAFDEAEGYAKVGEGRPPVDARKMQAALQRLAQLLGQFVAASAPRSTASPTRRDA